MIDKNLLDYIHAAQQQGLSKELIKQNLVANGWQSDMVEQAFGMVTNATAAGITPSSLVTHSYTGFRKPSINSHLSILLAIVLTVALFILTNKAITDISDYFSYSVTSSLIVNAFIILIFLLLAFGLHFTFGEKNEKYLILSRPYYIIAGWLLIRLLYEVSKYLLDRDSTYGVYVVLILVIAVLTGMVVFVQKYLRK